MASNTFGNQFKMTTWGESHGKAMGVVIDGCPAGLSLCMEDFETALAQRAPGNSLYTSPRKEPDTAEIYSGVFEGKTTGAPISIIIPNHHADSTPYESMKHLLRPGHANYTYLKKYGVFDHRGGGRASARETVCRVTAGVVAQKILDPFGIEILSYIHSIGTVKSTLDQNAFLDKTIYNSPIFAADQHSEKKMMDAILDAKSKQDSLGGIVAFLIQKMPVGLGDPVYEKLEANLAKAMFSIPASKGFEIGKGFQASEMRGSAHNDAFISETQCATNHAGGTLAGISTGMPLHGRVAFKPTSSIGRLQNSVTLDGKKETFKLPKGAKHDPCVAIRAVPVVKAMCQIVLADALLCHQAQETFKRFPLEK